MLTDLEIFILGSFGVWRVTHLLHVEKGPWNILERFRSLMRNILKTQLADCFYCLSFWVGMLAAFTIPSPSVRQRLFIALACSAGAIFLQLLKLRLNTPIATIEKPLYWEDKAADAETLNK